MQRFSSFSVARTVASCAKMRLCVFLQSYSLNESQRAFAFCSSSTLQGGQDGVSSLYPVTEMREESSCGCLLTEVLEEDGERAFLVPTAPVWETAKI